MITIDYRPTAPTLYRQLKGKVSPQSITNFETARSAINFLISQEPPVLTPKQMTGAFNRLTQNIALAANRWANRND